MNFVSIKHILLFVFIGSIGTLGGGLINRKLVSIEAARDLWSIGAAVLATGFVMLIILRQYAKDSVTARLVSGSLAMNIGFTWFLTCFVLPLFWLHGIFSLPSAGLIVFFVVASSYSIWRGHLAFSDRWKLHSDKALSSSYNRSTNTLNIDSLIKKIHVNAQLHLPRALEPFKAIIFPGLILSMLSGFALRSIYPGFSAFAWGVPALVIATISLQMGSFPIFLALKIKEFERRIGKRIKPMPDE